MSIKAPQVLIFVVCAAGMVGVLSVVRSGFRDQADDEFWNSLSGAGEEVAEMRAEEAKTLNSGSLPIGRAIDEYAAKGRTAFPQLKSASGQDVAPVAGWVHEPGFAKRAEAAKEFAAEHAQAEAPAAAAPAATPEPAAAAE